MDFLGSSMVFRLGLEVGEGRLFSVQFLVKLRDGLLPRGDGLAVRVQVGLEAGDCWRGGVR